MGAGRRGGKAAARRATRRSSRGAGTTWCTQTQTNPPGRGTRRQARARGTDARRYARRQLGPQACARAGQSRCDHRSARPHAGGGPCPARSGTGTGDRAGRPGVAGRDRSTATCRIRTTPCPRGDSGRNRRLDRGWPPCRPHRINSRCPSKAWRRGCALPNIAAQPDGLKIATGGLSPVRGNQWIPRRKWPKSRDRNGYVLIPISFAGTSCISTSWSRFGTFLPRLCCPATRHM